MASVEITMGNFEEEVLKSDKPVLVDFWAVWCGPCSQLSPVVEQIGEEHPEIKVGKVDTDKEPVLGQKFLVSAIPTLIFFRDGKPVGQSVGVVPKEQIEELIKK